MDKFIIEANSLLAVMTEYSAVTDRLLDIDLQLYNQEELSFAIDDMEEIIGEREEIKARLQFAQSAMESATDDIQSVRQLEVVQKLIDMQAEIMGKDKLIMSRFAAKQAQVKNELKTLQGERKKIDFLNVSTATPQEPTEFNV